MHDVESCPGRLRHAIAHACLYTHLDESRRAFGHVPRLFSEYEIARLNVCL